MTLTSSAFSCLLGGVTLMVGVMVMVTVLVEHLSLWRYPRTKTQSREEFISVIILIKHKLQHVYVRVMYYLYYISDCAYRCKVLVWSSRRVIIVEGRGLEKVFFPLFLSGRFSTTLLPSWTIISIISDNHNFPTKAGSPLEAVKSIATMKLSSIPP